MATKRPGVVFVLATFVLGSVGAILVASLIPGTAPSGNPDRLHREVSADTFTPVPACEWVTTTPGLERPTVMPCAMFGGDGWDCPTAAAGQVVRQTSDDFGTRWTTWGCPYFATETAEES